MKSTLYLIAILLTTFSSWAAEPPSRQSLVADVPAISTAGVPGPLAVFGENAIVLAVGQDDKSSVLPVAAAASWGKGRVVVLGHGGMIGDEALKHAGTSSFVTKAASWLNPHSGSIGVFRNESLRGLLTNQKVTTVNLEPGWHKELDKYAAVVVDSHSIGKDEREALKAYISKGGGLLTAGLGWGWMQLNPGKTIAEHPGNLLLAEAGIVWCDGTLEPTGKQEFVIGEVSPLVHASFAMQAMEEATTKANGKDAQVPPQAAKTLVAALTAIPSDDPLMTRVSALLEHNTANLVPTQGKPLRAKDGLARVLLSFQVEQERRTPAQDVKPHPASSAFPGEVPAGSPRVTRSTEIDLSIPGWHSTGLYAAPGEVITVKGEPRGCAVRIGCHTDQLWHHDSWQRVPSISREWPLRKGSTQVASAFGGLLYIQVPRATQGTCQLEIEGAVESPRYVLGQTSREEWLTSRLAPGPWGELESRKVIVSVPSSALRGLEDPESLMRFWDSISDAHATLATIPLVPPRPHRFVPDIQISAGYMHSGYPIMTHMDAVDDMVGVERLRRGTWGLLHELGHNHQEGEWTFEGTGEVTCNLFALHAIDTICTPEPGDRGHGAVNTPPSLAKYLEGGAKFEQWKSDPFLALHMYVQLEEAFGWETFKRVFAEYRGLSREERPRNDAEKRDQWMVRMSRACGRNLGPFFQRWGVPTSQGARDSISTLPEWMPARWP